MSRANSFYQKNFNLKKFYARLIDRYGCRLPKVTPGGNFLLVFGHI